MRTGLFIALLVVSGAAWSQVAKKNSKPITLFTINTLPIYTDEFIYLYQKNHVKPEDFTEKKIDEYLDLLINFKLKVMEARARGLDTTAAFKKEFSSYKNELKKPYLSEKTEVDRLTKEAYRRMTEEVKASHILISLRPDAVPADTLAAYQKTISIRGRILAGANFQEVAKEISDDPSAKTNAGSLGYFTALQMVYPFEQAAYNLNIGELSSPVRSRFGYHLIKVTDRKPARGEVEVSHIILRIGPGDNTKSKNKIHDIYDQIQGGRSWDELCKEYSDDPATKDSGGKLKPFGVGALPGLPEFETAAFSLKTPGEISDPFQTAYGWHIIRLERKMPIPPFKDVEAALIRKVSRDERLQLADRKLLEQKKIQFGFSENSEVKLAIFAFADSSLQQGKWKFKGEGTLRTQTIFTLQSQACQTNEFIHFVEGNQAVRAQAPDEYMSTLYNRFLEQKLEELEDLKLMTENPEYRNLLTEYREGILLFTIMEKEVWTRAPEDTAGLKKFYRENKNKYEASARVHAKVFTTTDERFLEEIKRKVTSGDSVNSNDLKKFKSVQPARNYERGENKGIDLVPWALGVHSAEVDKTYYLVEIDNLVPPGIKTFEEARAQVVSDYQLMVESRWISALKTKYPVKINSKGRKLIVSELIKK